jgi:hypothetical protein
MQQEKCITKSTNVRRNKLEEICLGIPIGTNLLESIEKYILFCLKIRNFVLPEIEINQTYLSFSFGQLGPTFCLYFKGKRIKRQREINCFN